MANRKKDFIKDSNGVLLAVDLGLRTGMALYGRSGRLIWYRSKHFANAKSLRGRVQSLFNEQPDLEAVVLEGGGSLAEIWEKEARRREFTILRVEAEEWRKRFFQPRQYADGSKAKRSAKELARRVIEWSGARRPTSLRSDAAEAILIGLWGMLEIGLLAEMPAVLR